MGSSAGKTASLMWPTRQWSVFWPESFPSPPRAYCDEPSAPQCVERIMKIPLLSLAQLRILSEGVVEPLPACESLPDDLQPQRFFTDEQIRKGLPAAEGSAMCPDLTTASGRLSFAMHLAKRRRGVSDGRRGRGPDRGGGGRRRDPRRGHCACASGHRDPNRGGASDSRHSSYCGGS